MKSLTFSISFFVCECFECVGGWAPWALWKHMDSYYLFGNPYVFGCIFRFSFPSIYIFIYISNIYIHVVRSSLISLHFCSYLLLLNESLFICQPQSNSEKFMETGAVHIQAHEGIRLSEICFSNLVLFAWAPTSTQKKWENLHSYEYNIMVEWWQQTCAFKWYTRRRRRRRKIYGYARNGIIVNRKRMPFIYGMHDIQPAHRRCVMCAPAQRAGECTLRT